MGRPEWIGEGDRKRESKGRGEGGGRGKRAEGWGGGESTGRERERGCAEGERGKRVGRECPNDVPSLPHPSLSISPLLFLPLSVSARLYGVRLDNLSARPVHSIARPIIYFSDFKAWGMMDLEGIERKEGVYGERRILFFHQP
jgi:hypothetical protein